MESKGKFYVFEGDNGVGKSSIIERLEASLPAKRIATPTKEYEKIRDYVHATNSTYGRFFYYLSSVFDASKKIEGLLKEDSKIIICDRYIVSTLAGFWATSDWELRKLKEFYDSIKDGLVMPDLTFLLRCSHEERVRRISQRNKGDSKKRDDLTPGYAAKISQFHDLLLEYETNWHMIDTTDKSIDTVVQEISGVISDGSLSVSP